MQNATDWMVSQGVSVIVHSVTHEYDGPGDGTSPFSDSPLRAVDRAVAGGTIWVNSAGNAGLRTWFGAYSNSDGDSYIDFNGFDEGIDIQLKAGDEITVQLRWEDSWSGATSDFDLFVYDHPTKVVVASQLRPSARSSGRCSIRIRELYSFPRWPVFRQCGSLQRQHPKVDSGKGLGCGFDRALHRERRHCQSRRKPKPRHVGGGRSPLEQRGLH